MRLVASSLDNKSTTWNHFTKNSIDIAAETPHTAEFGGKGKKTMDDQESETIFDRSF
jgi:hypothetical protein